jgi:hypothetical protein
MRGAGDCVADSFPCADFKHRRQDGMLEQLPHGNLRFERMWLEHDWNIGWAQPGVVPTLQMISNETRDQV